MKKILFNFFFLLLIAVGVKAQTYSGGIGTLGDPYQIASTTDLIYLSRHSEDWNKYFTQTADIVFNADETQVDWNNDGSADGSGTAGFSPIGNSTTNFTGNYNGTGHTIRNLFINVPGTGETTGLFGQTNGSTISNVGLIDAALTGGFDTGILAGNSSVGLISTFNNCYSTGAVSGVNNVGGLIGQLYSQSVINNCYSLANVVGSSNIGGLVGAFYAVSQVSNCYSAGLVTATGTSGGLIGIKDGSSTVTNSFWDTQTSGKSTSAGGTGKITAQMKVMGAFTNWDFTAGTGKWAIKSGEYISYPYLQGFSYDTPGSTPAVIPIPGLEDTRMILSYTVTAGAAIGLPLYGTVNVSIDWGDGSSAETVNAVGFIYHTYTNAGTYAVKISGTLTHFGDGVLPGYSHPEFLTSVTSFGSIGLSSLAGAFKGASNLTDVPVTLPASVTSLSCTFQYATKINDADICSWNVSQVTDMSGLFFGALIFNQPIGSWDVSNVLNMYQMFATDNAFNQDITSWNVANVTNMSNMFYEAWNFNQSIGSWNVGNVTDMSGMFSWAAKFNQNIGLWNVSKVTNMSWMFYQASLFNQNLGSWNIGNVTNMSQMFNFSGLTTTNYDALLNGWAALAPNLKSAVTMSKGPYYTSAAAAARQTLTGTYSWTITDAGLMGAITSITASEASPCAGTSITLTAAGTLTGCTVHWYTASCGGTEITTGLSGTYKEVLTVSPTATTTYYAKTEIGGSYSADCVSKEISVVPPLIYRSKQTGSWTTTTNWEQYNGSAWVTATKYPGEITNSCSNPIVTIQAEHLMEISGASISIPNLEIKNTGKLTLKASGKLTVSGQLILEQNTGGTIVKE